VEQKVVAEGDPQEKGNSILHLTPD
jgi:hypothetical protein